MGGGSTKETDPIRVLRPTQNNLKQEDLRITNHEPRAAATVKGGEAIENRPSYGL